MKTLLIAAAMGLVGLSAAAPADAQVNRRQWNQQERLDRGWRSGDLTRREYRHLQRQQHRINRYERHARWNDGRLGWRERARLSRMQDRAGRNIYRERRDWQDRRDWRGDRRWGW